MLADGLEAYWPIAAGQPADVSVPPLRWHEPGTGVLRIEYTHSNGNRYATESDVTIEGDLVRCITYRRLRSS